LLSPYVGDCLAVCTHSRPMMLDFLSSFLHSDDKSLSLGGIFTHLWWLVIYLSPCTYCWPVILDWLACFLHALHIHETSVELLQFLRPMKNNMYPAYYFILENNSKQIRTLIGLKPCFYSSRETQNLRELLTYILMIKVNKFIFLFASRYFLKDSSCFYRVIETLVKVWENSKKLWKHSPAACVST